MSTVTLLVSRFECLDEHFSLAQQLQAEGQSVIGVFDFGDQLDKEQTARYWRCVTNLASVAEADRVIINGPEY